jgi:hypothetical protein
MSEIFTSLEFGELKIAGHVFPSSQVEIAFYVLIALIVLLLSFLLVKLLKNFANRSDEKRSKAEPPEPQYEEIFEVETELFESSPYKSDPDSVLENSVLQTVSLTLIVGLREHLTKLENSAEMAENPSDQHKAMLAVANYLEAKQVAPIAFTQWNQSPIQGIAARIILNGKSRTALLGPSLAMVRATAKFPEIISAQVESAHAAGESVFVLAIDGLAYGVFSVSHRLVLIGSGDRI